MNIALEPVQNKDITQVWSSLDLSLMNYHLPALFNTPPAKIENIEILVSFAVQRRLAEIADLRENWDGYGALPIDKKAIENTEKLLKCLPIQAKMALHFENLVPASHGTVNLEWSVGDYFVSLEIGNEEIAFFSELPDGTKPFLDSVDFSYSSLPREFLAALNKLFSAR